MAIMQGDQRLKGGVHGLNYELRVGEARTRHTSFSQAISIVGVTAAGIVQQCQQTTKGVHMRTDMQGMDALKGLRQELQEDAGAKFPQDVLPQLLMLYDVCQGLDMNIFQAKNVLGEVGFQAVSGHINDPAFTELDVEKARAALAANS